MFSNIFFVVILSLIAFSYNHQSFMLAKQAINIGDYNMYIRSLDGNIDLHQFNHLLVLAQQKLAFHEKHPTFSQYIRTQLRSFEMLRDYIDEDDKIHTYELIIDSIIFMIEREGIFF